MMTALSPNSTSHNEEFSSAQIEAGLLNFLETLSQQHCSSATIRNYRSDIRQFYKHAQLEDLKEIFSKPVLKEFVLAQKQKGLKDSSVTRKIASITQFALWSKQQGLINQDVSWMTQITIENFLKSGPISIPNPPAPDKHPKPSFFRLHTSKSEEKVEKNIEIKSKVKKSPSFLKIWNRKKTQNKPEIIPAKEQKSNNNNIIGKFIHKNKTKKRSIAQTANNFILPYLNLGLIILFFIGLGFLGYNQLVTETPTSLAYPSIPTRPDRVLSFQGRLTDTVQNPITSATNMEFKIWSLLSGGTEGTCDGTDDCEYKTGTCSVTPDQDGIFNVGIGDDCGSEIDEAVFSENVSLWLEVNVGGETLTPRQPIRTVPFAVNSETVQGYPISASESATANTILVMDGGGFVRLGEDSPTLTSDTGTFTISGYDISLEATNDILFSDARVTDLPLSVVDTEIDAALGQGIVDAINDLYGISASSSFFDQTNNLIYPTEYWQDEFAIGGNSTSSADIWLSSIGGAVFNEQGNDADFRVESSGQENAFFVEGGSGNIGVGTNNPISKVDITGSVTGKSLVNLNQTGDSDIISASVSGVTRFVVDNGGYVNAARFVDLANSDYYLDPAATGYSLTTAGSVGIKTIDPDADLEIQSDSLNSDVLLFTAVDGSRLGRFTETGSGAGWFEVDNAAGSANVLFRGDGGSNYISSGNFGIGDTSPASLLTVGNGDLFQIDSTGAIVAIDGVAHSILDNSGDLELSSDSNNISLNDNVTFGGTTILNTVEYTWPGADGSSDALLTTNGAGVLSWSDNSSVGPFNYTDNVIYPDNYWADLIALGGNSTSSADILFYPNGSATFNAQGNDADFQVEGQTTEHLIYADASTNRVGIGTNSPASLLHIYGSTNNAKISIEETNGVAATRDLLSLANNGGITQTFIDNASSQTFSLRNSDEIFSIYDDTDAATRIAIDGDGNVGIGDTTPDHFLDVAGNIGVDAGSYINWGDTDGSAGYGFRDYSGTLQYKNSSGDWTNVGVATNTYWQLNNGSLSPLYLSTDINLGATATSSAKISLAGALDRGKSALIVNQTEDQDVFTASASGTTLFTIQNNGNIALQNGEYIQNSTDDLLVLAGSGGTTNTDLTIDLDGNNPVLYSTAGLGVEVHDRFYIGTNNRYFYDEIGQLRFSDDLRVDGSLSVGTVNATSNPGELITSSNIIIDNQGELRLRESSANGTEYTGFVSPASLTSTVLYTLPDTDGAVGSVLSTDSSGNLSWISNQSGDFWQENDGVLTPVSTTLGINLGDTATSSAKISLAGSLDRGQSALIVNQTENQDIFTASASGTTRFSIDYDGNLDVTGNIGLAAGNYINWGSVLGTTGYGFRDLGGTLQFKHDGGTWQDVGTGTGGGGGSSSSYWDLSAGSISPYFPTTDVNFGDSATASAKVSIAGSLDRGKSALIINQSEDQDIFTASASGTTRLQLTNDGDLDVYGSGTFGSLASIDDYITINARENYTDIDTESSYSLYLNQTRTESAPTGNTFAYGSYNNLLYRVNENTYDGTGYGSFDQIYTDGSYTYANLIADQNVALSNSDAASGQDSLIGGLNEAYLNSDGNITDVFGSKNSAYNNSTGNISNTTGVLGSSYTNNANATIDNATGVKGSVYENGGSITTGKALEADCDDAATCYGLYINANDLDSTTGAYGIWGENGDWILDQDGAGSPGDTSYGGDLFFGEDQDAAIWYDGVDFKINPRIEGAGDLYVTDGAIKTELGQFKSNVADGGSSVAYEFNTVNNLTVDGALIADFQNQGTSLFTIDKDGNVWAKGNIYSDKGFGMSMKNIGSDLSQYDLVVINTTEDNDDGVPRMSATTSAMAKEGFGVVQESCTSGSTCKVVFQGETLVNVSNSTDRGQYLYSSSTEGQAISHSKQYDGLLGIATSTDVAAPYQVEMIFMHQPAVSKLRVADKNRMHADYREAAIDYTYANETNYYDIDENVRKGLFFDTFQDKIKVDSGNSDSIVDNVNQRAGLFGGITLDDTNTDSEGNTLLSENTVNHVYYFDRTNNETRTEPDTLTQVLNGVDPNWYNGVSLVDASRSGITIKAPTNLSETYNGGLIKATGRYATGEDDGAILITVKSDNEATDSANPTLTIDWKTLDDPNSPAHSGTNVIVTKGTATTLETGTDDITVTFSHTQYNAGNLFKIASWYLEPIETDDRGSRQSFPERSNIIATNDSVSIIDADTNKVWMVFDGGGQTMLSQTDKDVSSLQMFNGKLYIGNNVTSEGLIEIDFAKDTAYQYVTNNARYYVGNGIYQRNVSLSENYFPFSDNNPYELSSSQVNDIHVNIVGKTEIIALATDDGINVINKLIGKTVALYDTATDDYNQVWLTSNNLLYATNETKAQLEIWSEVISQTSDNSEYKRVLDESSEPTIFDATPTISTNPDALVVTAKDSRETEEITLSGWGYVEGDGSEGAIDYMYYGVTFDEIPVVHVTSYGNTNDVVPSNLSECNKGDSTAFDFGAQALRDRAQIKLIGNIINSGSDKYYCYSWTATGSISSVSQKSNIFLGTNEGLIKIGEHLTSSLAENDSSVDQKSIKRYTKDYISEELIGDVGYSFPFNGTGGIADGTTGIASVAFNSNEVTASNANASGLQYVSGVRGTAIEFDGVDDLLCGDINEDGTCDDSGDAFDAIGTYASWSFWLNPDTIADGDGIISKGSGGGFDIYFNSNDSLTLQIASTDELIGTTPIPTEQWTHVTLTYDDNNNIAYMYVNGSLVQVDTSATTALNNATDEIEFGNYHYGQFYDGKLDEVTFTNTLLTPFQVKNMYESGKRALDQSHQFNDYANNLDNGSNSAGAYSDVSAVGIQHINGNSYAYVAIEDGDEDEDGWINKIDLSSDTVVQTYSTTSDIALPSNDVTSIAVSSAGLELVGMNGTGAMAVPYNSNMGETSGIYYSDTITLPENINNAYAWINQYIDSDCSECSIKVYASNNGGSTWAQGTVTATDNNQSLPEKEYIFSFTSGGSQLKFRVDFTRDSNKEANVYIEKYGIAWFDDDDVLGGSTGGIFTNSADTIQDGEYIELAHNQGTNDIFTEGWVYNTTSNQWETIAGATSSAYTSKFNGGNLIRNYPSLENAKGHLGGSVQPEWWDSAVNGDLVEASASAEGVEGINETVLKLTNSGANGHFSQTLYIEDEPLLATKSSQISAGVWVYSDDPGSINLDLYSEDDTYNQVRIARDSTTTTGEWVYLKVEDISILNHYLIFRIVQSNASATTYIANPQLNVGPKVMSWNERQLRYVDSSSDLVYNADPSTAISIIDLSGYSSPLTAKVDLGVFYLNNITNNTDIYIYPYFPINSSSSWRVLRESTSDNYRFNDHTTMTNDLQEIVLATSSYTNNESVVIHLRGYYEWDSGQSGIIEGSPFQIVQVDENTVRLYNYSGKTQQLRLDVATAGVGSQNGTVSLAPFAADVDADANSNSIWINKTDESGTLLKLQNDGTDRFAIDYGGNATISGSLKLNGQLQLANYASNPTAMGTGAIYYDTTEDAAYIYNGSNWTALGSGGSGSSYWALNSGALTPLQTSYEINLGNAATDSAKISLAGSNDRGKAAVIINQTEDQDIFTASASGDTKLTITNNGDLIPGVDDAQDIGSNSFRWQDLFLGPDTLHIGSDLTDEYTISYNDTTDTLGFNVNGSGNPEIAFDSLGRVGIGEATPSAQLDVSGKVTGQALIQFNERGDQDIIAASVSGVTRMKVDNDGYVHSQRFIDLANETFFLDPAATGMSLNAAGDGTFGGGEVFFYDSNTYITGDGTNLSFKDSYLTDPLALSESGTTQLHAGFTMNSIVAALNELMAMSLGDQTNIFLNSFRQQEENGLLYQLFEDGVADEFEGLDGISIPDSAYTYDSTNDYFSRANPASDIVHDTQSLFDTGTTKENLTTTASPTIQLAQTTEKGDGTDGDITVSTTVNINSDPIGTDRVFADGIAYKVNGIATNAVATIDTPHGIEIGDEVLLINLQGDPSNYSSVGAYEFKTVTGVSGLNISFATSVQKNYGIGGNTNLSGQDIFIQRVPQYGDVTIQSGGFIVPGAWDNAATTPTTPTGTAGYQTGIIAFRATGKVDVQTGGGINANGAGYRGGYGDNSTNQDYTGESTSNENDTATTTPLQQGGGGGGGTFCHGGGGGSYATAGTNGQYPGTNCTTTANGNSSQFGDANLSTIYLGSGGGGGSVGYSSSGWVNKGGDGGDGGGIIFITANEIDLSGGTIRSDGGTGQNGSGSNASNYIPAGGGGGGTGGSIYLKADIVDVATGTLSATGANGGNGAFTCTLRSDAWCNASDVAHGGSGGDGRIKIDSLSITGTSSPTAVESTPSYYKNYGIFTSDEINTPNTISFDEFIWTEILNTHGEVQVMTRSGGTADSTDGTWEEWRPVATNTNELIIDNMDAHTNWIGYGPQELRQRTEAQFATGLGKERIIESGDLDGQLDIERNIDQGTGADGDITVTVNPTYIDAQAIASGRTYPDAVNYSVSSISSYSLVTYGAPNGIVAGDEVLLINQQGDAANYDSVGQYEFLKVESVSGTTLNFETAISKVYGVSSNLDLTGQKITVQRVPQYNNVTISGGGALMPSDWDGNRGGIIAFRAAGTVDVGPSSYIYAGGDGYRGGGGYNVYNVAAYQGEAQSGTGALSASANSVAGGGGGGIRCQGGGGGAHGTAGGNGIYPGTYCGTDANGATNTVSDNNLSTLTFGGAGGGGSVGYSSSGGWIYTGANGGDSGGIIYVAANHVSVDSTGFITAPGAAGGNTVKPGGSAQIPQGAGGGGSGGSVYLLSNTASISGTLAAEGGAGGTTWLCNTRTDGWCDSYDYANGGAGGDGRIRVDANEISGTSNPTYTAGITNQDFQTYGIYTSDELSTTNSSIYDEIEWIESLGNVGDIQVLTRSGNTPDSTDGSWEAWGPDTTGTNRLYIEDLDTHTDWVGTNMTVADGDVARDKDLYEDEDSLAADATKFSSSTQDGYAEIDLGAGNEVNLSNFDYVSFWVRSDVPSDTLTFSMGENAGNEQSEKVYIDQINEWQKVYWDITDIAVNDRDSIRYLRIRNDEIPTVTFYLDNIEAGRFHRDYLGESILSTEDSYIQYRVIMTTTDITSGPTLDELTLNYRTSGTNTVVAEGDTIRNVDYYEDEDEFTDTNITKLTFAAKNGYTERDLGLGNEIDVSAHDYVSFWIRSSETGQKFKFSMGESSSTEQEEDITINTADTWQKVYWDVSDISDSSLDAIRYLRLTYLGENGATVYLDDIVADAYMSDQSGTILTSSANEYVQYRLLLSTTTNTVTPTVSYTKLSYTDQLGHIDGTQSDFDSGTDKFQAESSSSGTLKIANNTPNTGTGEDGSVTITVNPTYIDSDIIASGRSYPDGVNYGVSSIGTNTLTISEAPNGIKDGDEIILINLQGDIANGDTNVGNYEFLIVDSINGNTLTFTNNIQKTYGESSNSDLSGQKIRIQRVPQYNNVTVVTGGALLPTPWNGTYGGLIVFRATGTVDVEEGASIWAKGAGYRGGSYSTVDRNYDGYQGESTAGTGSTLVTENLEAGGGGGAGPCHGGGGGSHATVGGDGLRPGTNCGYATNGADTVIGDQDLNKMYLGGGGGGGTTGYSGGWNDPGGTGGNGGGIIYISANNINVEDGISSDGYIAAHGSPGENIPNYGDIPAGAGGGGAGGSMYLIADTVSVPGITTANGGAGGTTYLGARTDAWGNTGRYGNGGAGGDGRIRIDANSITGTTSPSYYAGTTGSGSYYPFAVFTSDEINTAGATSYDAISWTENLGTGGMIQMMTRSGSTADSTDGTWEEWKPVDATNEAVLNNADTHGEWVGYAPGYVLDDTEAEFNEVSVEKHRVSVTTTPSVKLDHDIDDGDGADGPVTISTGIGANTNIIASGRSYADMIAYKVDASTATGTSLTTTDTINGIAAGDEVLLINLQGATGDTADVGNYEFLEVSSVAGTTINFNSTIQNSYDGTTAANQKVVIQRVPNYTNVTVENGGYLIGDQWDGLTTTPAGNAGYYTGIVAFRSSGTIDVQAGGGIHSATKGYRGGSYSTVAAGYDGYQGESTSGTGSSLVTENLEGGGGGGDYYCQGGGGGSHATVGGDGLRPGSNCGNATNGADTVIGDQDLNKMYLGGGGGGGTTGYSGGWNDPGGAGGNGGGIVYIAGETIEVDSHPVTSDAFIGVWGGVGANIPNYGDIPAGAGGGGAGGTMYIQADKVTFDDNLLGGGGAGGTTYLGARTNVWGDTGRYGNGGAGGDGRIRIDANEIRGTSTPTYYDGSSGQPFHGYGIYTSNELSTNGTTDFKKIELIETLASYSDVQVLTRSGNTADSTSGTWESWKPATGGLNVFAIDNMDTHTNWTGTNITVADGDITRDKNFYEDEDESTAGNITKLSTSTVNGYVDRDLGSGNEVDLSSANYVSFWIRGSKSNSNFQFSMGEATPTEQSENFKVELADTWQKVYWDISDLSAAQRDSIRYLRITYLDDENGSVDLYVDNIVGNDFFTTETGNEIQSSADNYIQYRLIFSTTDKTGTNDDREVHAVKANYVTNSAFLYSQEGDVTRNVDYYEDEDELTSAAITRVVSTSTASENHFVESTISPTDISNYDYVSFWIRTTATNTEIPMRVGIGEDEGDELEMDFVVETPFQWQKVFFDLTDIPSGDRDAITKLRITNFGPYVNDIYIDDFTANKYIETSGSGIDSTADSYFQYRAILTTTDTTSFPYLDQVSLAYSGLSDVVSKDYVANTLPKRANLISWADLGTGGIDYWASRDGGNTWTEVTMEEQATESGTTKIYSGFADLTSQPEGTDMRWRARITGNAVLKSMAMRWEEGGGADLAEWYPTNDKTIEAAEVISADTTSSKSGYIRRTTKAYDPTVLGIISTAPGVQIGEYAENTKRVALAGRVPVKVASTSAAITTGDFITSSDQPGKAMKATKTGYTIGKALEDWTPESGKETVMVFVNLGTHINEDDIGGVDNSSIEEIFGETTPEVLGDSTEVEESTDSAEIVEDNKATDSAEINIDDATESAQTSGSALLNPDTATDSATIVQESLTSRLRKIAEERLDAMFSFTGQETPEATDEAQLEEALNIVTEDSITKSQATLWEARDKFVNYGETVGNTVGASTINAFNGLNAASATIYGRLVASSADIYGKLTAVSGEFIDLFARRVETEELATDMISPIDPDGLIRFRLGENSDATGSGTLVIEDASGSAVTTFDSEGNITTLGDLIAAEVITSTVSADLATFVNASVSGELDATSARLEQLESKLAQIEELDAQTANIVNATVSGTLFADEISNFSEKVAQAIEEPSLLEKIMGTNNTNSVESIDSYFANHDSFVTELDTTSATRLGIDDLNLTEDDLVIDATAVYVDQYFDVNGSAFIAENLSVGQSLVLSDSMYITAGSIDYSPVGINQPTLSIQPSGKGLLSLMAGLFELDDTGLAKVNGDLTVAGDLKVDNTLLTNMISANDFTNPFQVQLATVSGEVLGDSTEPEVQESRFEILNELGIPVATISAQGKADFASGIGIGSENLEITDATDSAQIETKKTSGTATIKANSSEIVIKSPNVSEESLIYVTPMGSTGNRVLYVKEITNDDPETEELESYFKVGFDTNVSSDVKFNWWIVN